eukprot:10806938-Alexandrium_andersonii.AAC.1
MSDYESDYERERGFRSRCSPEPDPESDKMTDSDDIDWDHVQELRDAVWDPEELRKDPDWVPWQPEEPQLAGTLKLATA